MAEYIEREALLKWAREFYPNDRQFASAVINAPSADVVEVVRCRDCKWHDSVDGPMKQCDITDDDDFCSYGVKED